MVLRASTWTASALALSRHQRQCGRGRAEPSGGTSTRASGHRPGSDRRWQTCARLARGGRRSEGKTRVRQKPDFLHSYRDAAWLVKRHAVTVLPSVASLKALRVFARKGQGTKPMIGFGDPVFAPDQAAAPADSTVKMASRTRAYSDYWHGASVDRARLADALSPLPDSAEGLKAVAAKLGPRASAI